MKDDALDKREERAGAIRARIAARKPAAAPTPTGAPAKNESPLEYVERRSREIARGPADRQGNAKTSGKL